MVKMRKYTAPGVSFLLGTGQFGESDLNQETSKSPLNGQDRLIPDLGTNEQVVQHLANMQRSGTKI